MRPFRDTDLREIEGWYSRRGLVPPPQSCFPATGYIMPEVAAMFLWSTDSCICLLDGAITNPAAPIVRRASALKAITQALIAQATRGGFTQILGYCHARSTARLVRQHGFRKVGVHELYVREA